MKREPLLVPALALAVGILIPDLYSVPRVSIILLAGAAVAAYGSALFFSPLRRFRSQALLACAVSAGLFTADVHREVRTPKLNAEDGESLLVSGCISDPPVFSPGREQFTLDLAPKTSARISVNLAKHI